MVPLQSMCCVLSSCSMARMVLAPIPPLCLGSGSLPSLVCSCASLAVPPIIPPLSMCFELPLPLQLNTCVLSPLIPLYYMYRIFSPRNHYVYIGETSTPGREHQHVLALRSPSRQSQYVHRVMAGADPPWVCFLPMSFPAHVDRRTLELTLIRRFDPLGSHLLNTSGRHRRSTKISF